MDERTGGKEGERDRKMRGMPGITVNREETGGNDVETESETEDEIKN